MREPTQTCASCGHTLSLHFLDYARGMLGCSHTRKYRQWYANTDYDDFTQQCSCLGFSEIIPWSEIGEQLLRLQS